MVKHSTMHVLLLACARSRTVQEVQQTLKHLSMNGDAGSSRDGAKGHNDSVGGIDMLLIRVVWKWSLSTYYMHHVACWQLHLW